MSARLAEQRASKRVLIVGAGVSGLSAAYLLQRARPELELCVLDRAQRAGGVIHSELTREGFLLETGPDSLVTWKPEGVAMLDQLGLLDDVVAGGEHRRSWVKLRDRLEAMPEGLQGALPASPGGVFRGSLFSLSGKLRIACEPLIPARREPSDESVRAFVTRRFGAQALDRLVAPLLGGIYACDPSELSAQAVLGAYLEQEKKHGSIARALASKPRAAHGGNGSLPPVISLRQGMGQLTSQLAAALGGALRLGTSVVQLSRSRHGQLLLTTDHGGTLTADAVILACPPAQSAHLLRQLAPGAAQVLANIQSSDVLHVQLAWPTEACLAPLNATGYVVAPSEGGALSACSFSSNKLPGRAPSSHLTFRCFLRDTDLSDAQATRVAISALRSDLQLTAAPSFVRVTRLRAALPRYRVGHLEHMAQLATALAATPDIQLAGNAYLGPGIPDCIRSATRAVTAIVDQCLTAESAPSCRPPLRSVT